MAKRVRWSIQMLRTEARKYTTRGEFQKESKRAYSSALRKGVLDDICSHMVSGLGSNRKWNKESLLEIAMTYDTLAEFREREHSAYQACHRLNLTGYVMGHLSSRTRWDVDKVKIEALKYTSRSDFQRSSIGAWDASKRLGIREEVCSHMIRPNIKWTEDAIREEALKYTVREELKKCNKSAYNKASGLGILVSVCAHMENGLKCDDDSLYLWQVPGTDIYKIGVTSARLGIERIKKVSSALGKGFNIVKHIVGVSNAAAIETKMLKIGRPVFFSSVFTGSTEFRTLTQKELMQLKNVFDSI